MCRGRGRAKRKRRGERNREIRKGEGLARRELFTSPAGAGLATARTGRCFPCYVHSQLCSKLTLWPLPKSCNPVPDPTQYYKLMSALQKDSPNSRNLSGKLSPSFPLMTKRTIGRAHSPRSSFHGAEVIDAAANERGRGSEAALPSQSLCVRKQPPPSSPMSFSR